MKKFIATIKKVVKAVKTLTLKIQLWIGLPNST